MGFWCFPHFSIIESLDPPDFHIFLRPFLLLPCCARCSVLVRSLLALSSYFLGRRSAFVSFDIWHFAGDGCTCAFPALGRKRANSTQLPPITTNYPPITMESHHQLRSNYTKLRTTFATITLQFHSFGSLRTKSLVSLCVYGCEESNISKFKLVS